MNGSRAAGCLVVLQGPPTSPDIFRALLRAQSQDTVSTTIPLPLSTYTLYGYDIEGNALPDTMPAVILENMTHTLSGFEGNYLNEINRQFLYKLFSVSHNYSGTSLI